MKKIIENMKKSTAATKTFIKTPQGKLYIAYLIFEMYAIYTFIKINKENKKRA